jgi:hypothetical protein
MRIVIPALLLIALAGCQQSSGPRKIAIVGAKLVDGKGGVPIEHSIVIIEGATVVEAGAQTSVPLPKDVEIVDGMNKTIEPAPAAQPINAGNPASLVLKSGTGASRTMKDGQWQN